MIKIFFFGDDIHGTAKTFQGAILFEDMAHGIPTHSLFVVIHVPAALDAVEQGGAARGVGVGFMRIRVAIVPQQGHFASGLRILFAAGGGRDAVGAGEAIVILLGAKQRFAVAVSANNFRVGSERAHDPEMHRAGIRLRVDVAPIDLAGLKFHQTFEPINAAMEIV